MDDLPAGVPRAAYIHVPFCAHRCGYCDFTLVADRDDLIGEYLRAMELELERLDRPCEIDTLFFGGGTPTHLAAGELERLLDLVLNWFPLRDGYEFSIEANPAGFTTEKMRLLSAAGVNRVSLGVQSFDDGILKFLERDHLAEDILRVTDELRSWCGNFSVDLIFGVPGMSLDLWRETLDMAVGLKPSHVSTYGLTIERGTAFWSRQRKGQLISLTPELERAMYGAAMDLLSAAGYEQYEISSFASSGFRCRHNLVYWSGASYFGVGPGAARYLDGRRETNHRSVTTWMKRLFAGEDPCGESEELSPVERAHEALVIGLRLNAGIDRARFVAMTGYDACDLAADAIAKHEAAGLMEVTDAGLRLTREGRFLADTVAVDLL